jgi:thioredoxin 2
MHVMCPACLAANRVPRARFADRPVCGKCRAPLLPAEPIALSGDAFDRYVGGSDAAVLVDFWAAWCGPCRMMAPILDEVARDRLDLRIVKLDTEADPETAGRFGIRSIPTLILLQRGREIARHSGAVPAPQLLAWVDAALATASPPEGAT